MHSQGLLAFRPIDLELHERLCRQFREDSYVVSYGDAARFHEEDGEGATRYIDRLRAKMLEDPMRGVHVWQGGEIIGQMEFRAWWCDPAVGYINLFYLIEQERNNGLGGLLHDFAVSYLRTKGHSRARLSVIPTNRRAVRFYEKHGWRDLGPRPDSPTAHYMERSLG